MSGTQERAALANYRDAVAERIRGGEPFGEVEDSIDAAAELGMHEKAALWLFAFSLRKAALWLFAFSLRDPAEQQLDARAHLASLQ